MCRLVIAVDRCYDGIDNPNSKRRRSMITMPYMSFVMLLSIFHLRTCLRVPWTTSEAGVWGYYGASAG